MKIKFYAALIALLVSYVPVLSNAQVTVYLSIPNPATITRVSAGVPTFSIADANVLVSRYNVTGFTQLYPNHRFEFMQHVYALQCRDEAFAVALKNNWPAAFPYYELHGTPQNLAYYPNDWGYGNYGYLNYIGMPNAWDISKGDTGTVIGISDNYFDMANPDLQNYKVKRLTYNVPPNYSWDFGHGTTVAGIASGGTDNHYAYPGVGFNCRLDLVGIKSTDVLASMSDRNCAAVNASWGTNAGFDLGYIFNTTVYDQTNLQYAYENGTLTVAAAGNGQTGSPGFAGQYFTPASLDHVMSVTNVGWANARNGSTNYNVQGAHECYQGDSVNHCYQHNTRVDICAPAFDLGAIAADSADTSRHYLPLAGTGTSFAAPQVTGVAGLMHSVNSCLSPYQLEWILKSTANDSILGYPENLKYAGRLGAGGLRAGAAVAKADFHTFSCNDAATQTMFIQGLEFNTICAPGYSSNGVVPHLTPVITNGTAPFTARWVPIPGNEATLNDVKALQPTVTAATGGKLLYYHLTVYDSDPVAQKVADKIIRIQLDTAALSDFAMRDSYVDMLDEPNSQATVDARNWEIWH
ncbi:S8 family peptidase, partial [Chitinophaga eiseniae]